MESFDIKSAALKLHTARLKGFTTEPLKAEYPQFGETEAYEILWEGIKLRQSIGEELIGFKMGLTSIAKQTQMGLKDPIYGVLTNSMKIPTGSRFNLGDLVQPKAEPELVFQISKPLSGNVTIDEVKAAIGGVAAGIEILDSRFTGFKYFSLPDVIADNASASHFLVGPFITPKDFAFENLGICLKINGIEAGRADGRAVMGNPLNSVVKLCELISKSGMSLKPGEIVLTGGVTSAMAIEPGMIVQADIDGLLSATLTLTGETSARA